MTKNSRYVELIEYIFHQKFQEGKTEFEFERHELVPAAKKLKIALPKNLGDIIYSFRYRSNLPESIRKKAPAGKSWVIRPIGQGKYQFSLTKMPRIIPNESLAITKVPDSTPGIITKYTVNDEQALLSKIRYNRLIDIFTSVTCYSLQNHLRTTVIGMGQVETDEIYVGVDRRGVHYVFPVQVKGGSDQLGIVQIEQDFALCSEKYPSLICKPIAAQFMENDLIALFAFEKGDQGVVISDEKHYLLVPPSDLNEDDLKRYQERS